MIGRECKHIETGHIGKITQELKGCDKFKAQWGIFWYDGRNGKEHAERNKIKGLLYFWHDKDKIEIL